MTVVVIGGAGFIGQRLVRRILSDDSLTLPDGTKLLRPRVVAADQPGAPLDADIADRVDQIALDIRDPDAVVDALADAQAVFHLAAVVSGQSEAEFDFGHSVNFDGTRVLLETLRAKGAMIPFVMTSTTAVYGGNAVEPLTEATATQPRGSYGIAKAMSEMLMTDYRRKGFVEARGVRLPTIIVRPGKPNAAASSFASGIFREPLAGMPAVCPVDPGIAMWLASPETAVEALYRSVTVPSADWPDFSTICCPGLTATVGEMLEALEAVGGSEARDLVTLDPDPAIERLVASWPARFDTRLAHRLGMKAEEQSMIEIVERYVRSMK